MDRIEGWNIALFTLINADTGSPRAIVLMARIVAEAAPLGAAAVLAFLWIRRDRQMRFDLLDATLAALLGLTIAQGITHLWYHPRPFELGLGHQFMPHAAEASFPSDHATLLFGLALPLLLAASTRVAGIILAALALGTAWARVYLGVHFPLDMAGGFAVAVVSTLGILPLRHLLRARAYPSLDRLYESVITRLGLPDRFFPRAGDRA